MTCLAQRNDHHQFSNAKPKSSLYSLSGSNGSISASGFWSTHRGDISYNQLHKFWTELPPQARQELLRIDKQTLFEKARKNMYCSRCNGLLLEGFLQIVMYGKSLQNEGTVGHPPCNRLRASDNQTDDNSGITTVCQDDVLDPSVHPWGGLTTTRDGTLTVLDCYLCSKSLKGLQNVFDSARARERERELLYPDACGGGGRGWISQGMAGYGRGHGTREACALHTARLSVDTLVDFWSALGEETRQSLLRMKEEDFIERLMYRFDSKRFCRDCRRNVIREFKELKELKRMRREPRCTSWFCAADAAFQYEVSHDTVQADWHQSFADTVGKYQHFEWAIGTGEGKFDIMEFEDVGTSGNVQVDGLDLGGLSACYITLRACKMDGRCTEISVKAHAMKGQQCVHSRLVVGDGFVTITRGESIRRFFEHAEEAEEEEDDDSMDKDGSELDGECSRPQKHAKNPELAREFLLDAATVIFKEQVEKAFRDGTARQNAHSIFVCLALNLLEKRVHVACKEIITLEKQMKLLEEEEKEKREEEERKERRRTKEREKKLRRKERLRGKEKDREKISSESYPNPVGPSVDEEPSIISNRDSVSETSVALPNKPLSPDIQDEPFPNMSVTSNIHTHFGDGPDEEFSNVKEGNSSLTIDHSIISRPKQKFRKDFLLDSSLKWPDRQRFAVVSESGGMVGKSEPRFNGDNFEFSSTSVNGLNKQLRTDVVKSNFRNGGLKYSEKFHCSNCRMSERYEYNYCSCNQYSGYRAKVEMHDSKSVIKSGSVSEVSKPYYRGSSKYNQSEYSRESCGRPKNKIFSGGTNTRESYRIKKVWEPMETQKKYPRSSSDSDMTLRSSNFKVESVEPNNLTKSSDAICSDKVAGNVENFSGEENSLEEPINFSTRREAEDKEVEPCPVTSSSNESKDPSMSSISNSDNFSSCLSEGDSNTSSSNSLSASDSEDATQNLEGRETSVFTQNGFPESHEISMENKPSSNGGEDFRSRKSSGFSPNSAGNNFSGNLPEKTTENDSTGIPIGGTGSQHQGVLPPMHNNQSIQFPMFQDPPGPTMGYYHQSTVSWSPPSANGFISFANPNHYVYANPYEYGLNGNSHFMQYGALQHLTPPPVNPVQIPVYPTVARGNGVIPKEQIKISKPGVLQESHNEANIERVVPKGHRPPESRPSGDVRPNGYSGSSGFSLFHFGGPVALSTGKSNPMLSKEEIPGDFSSNLSADHVEDDHACNKKDKIEEYNLFAASNGVRFSFF